MSASSSSFSFSSPPPFSASSTLDDFDILNEIGRGSYGSVFRVRRHVDGMLYVLKQIPLVSLSPKEQEDALNEVRILSSLRCEYIVTYYDSFIDRGQLNIVMELAEKGSLHGLLMRTGGALGRRQPSGTGGLSESQIWSYFIQLCVALSYIHARKILHRDVKSMNVFLAADDTVKLGDFGVAKVLDNSHGMAQTMVGTPYYLSPELCENKSYNDKSDVWALGCVLYEMCTLRHPFDANNQGALLLKILRGKFPAIPSAYSQDLRDLVSQCLCKSVQRRPSTAELLRRPIVQAKARMLGISLPEPATAGGSIASSSSSALSGPSAASRPPVAASAGGSSRSGAPPLYPRDCVSTVQHLPKKGSASNRERVVVGRRVVGVVSKRRERPPSAQDRAGSRGGLGIAVSPPDGGLGAGRGSARMAAAAAGPASAAGRGVRTGSRESESDVVGCGDESAGGADAGSDDSSDIDDDDDDDDVGAVVSASSSSVAPSADVDSLESLPELREQSAIPPRKRFTIADLEREVENIGESDADVAGLSVADDALSDAAAEKEQVIWNVVDVSAQTDGMPAPPETGGPSVFDDAATRQLNILLEREADLTSKFRQVFDEAEKRIGRHRVVEIVEFFKKIGDDVDEDKDDGWDPARDREKAEEIHRFIFGRLSFADADLVPGFYQLIYLESEIDDVQRQVRALLG